MVAIIVVALAVAIGGSKVNSSGAGITFARIGTSQLDSVLIPPGTPGEAVNRAVRAHCAGRSWCKVLGWSNADYLPGAMPLTDREAAAQIYSYTLNRETGADEAMFDCRAFKSSPTFRCEKFAMATPD